MTFKMITPQGLATLLTLATLAYTSSVDIRSVEARLQELLHAVGLQISSQCLFALPGERYQRQHWHPTGTRTQTCTCIMAGKADCQPANTNTTSSSTARPTDTVIDNILIIHGGAGTVITPEHAEAKKVGLIEAIRAGYRALAENGNPLDAVEQAVRVMENSPAFNAGTGSVQTITGEVEMDAIIINGTDLSTGAVGAVRHIKNPVSLARLVKDTIDPVLIVGQSAEIFALNNGVTLVPTSDLIANFTQYNTIRHNRSSTFDVGTVGAVAINTKGQIGVATSTGGLTGKLDGRIGDSPIVGGGSLADDEIAGISSTGDGEAFIRFRVASRIANLIEQGTSPTDAISTVLTAMTQRIPKFSGGAIAISKDGDIGFAWNSEEMAWAYCRGSDIHYGVNKEMDQPHQIAPLHSPLQRI